MLQKRSISHPTLDEAERAAWMVRGAIYPV